MPYIAPSKRIYKFEYDFSIHGGVTGSITMSGVPVPTGGIVTDALMQVVAAAAGGAANTLAVTLEGAGDVQNAAARNGAPWSTLGSKRVTHTATAAPLVTTTDRSAVLVIDAADLTGGHFVVYLTVLERD